MSHEQREAYRWQFAGQIASAMIVSGQDNGIPIPVISVDLADAIISELEKTTPAAPKACEHQWGIYKEGHIVRHRVPDYKEMCSKCGAIK